MKDQFRDGFRRDDAPNEVVDMAVDLARFMRFPIEQYVNLNVTGNSGWIIDVACGEAEPAVGLINRLRGQGYRGGYFGCDILNYPSNFITTFRKVLREGHLRQEWVTFWQNNEGFIRTAYGNEWDATKTTMWSRIEKEVGSAALLLLRHPDVRSDKETFEKIFINMIGHATSLAIPIIITTSNGVTQKKIYEGLVSAMGSLGFQVTMRRDARDYDGVYGQNFTYSSNKRAWYLTTYDSRSYSRFMGEQIIEGYIVKYRLDGYTLALTFKKN